MKVWVKLLSGAVFGIVLGAVLPFESNALLARAIEFLPELALRIGRYAAPPLVVFSLTVAIYELREDGRFWSLAGKSLLVIAAAGIITIAFGLGLCRLFFQNGRIPIIVESSPPLPPLSPAEDALQLFPSNMLSPLTGDGLFLFPFCIFAFFFAIGLSYDKNFSRPVFSFFDSLSRIFFHIAAFFSEILGALIIVLAAFSTFRYRNILTKGIYADFIRLILVITLSFAFVVLPLLFYLFYPKKHISPWAKVYGVLAPALAAFFSGDINWTLPVLFHHTKENLGVRRRVNALTVTLFSVIGRAGSAMIAAVSFVVILQSYSSLEIQWAQYLQIGLRALLISILLGRNSGNGAFAALSALCLWAPEGYETGYLILQPVGFLLISCGALIDCMSAALGTALLARMTPDGVVEKTVKNFV